MDEQQTGVTQDVGAMVDAATSGEAKLERDDPLWFKDAIIYQLHIKAFADSNNDGIGDFRGLMQHLDYVQQLGVTAIWLLPFYPSPLRDDGYDIAEYKAVNPSYGDMRDVKRFVAEAHKRGIRVITELVINHTSDEHPWFRKARKAKPGSAARDFYVWSDTDEKYPETRIIFLDTETSNWTWDEEAGAYFWHRFYSHQPDLNFDNPKVFDEVVKIMDFWLKAGVDGLRLDAIPYIIEREGTNNENLPETHDVLKRMRAELDKRYPDRMFLAEANQWPEDTRPYFGEGDECHMAFHFPLMPRMYMALAQEDRHPITDIIRQTPDIPDNCQWAIFLRNHDELTLEMVTEEERDYLWRTYAGDRRARINLGIRRRLAPLMQNDRRKIELMNAMLLSMPGTPVIYYGDELGMGDNYYLGDRDGVRTPMQWSADRNGGFSRADPQRLYLPPIMDPIYGYQAVNVESQQSDPSSLLNWMRRMLAVRKQHQAFGRGEIDFLYPANRKVLAYVRSRGEERILCVVNLSRTAQAVELDMHEHRGRVPLELTGRSPFPPIGDLPYMLTLPAYGFYWFLLTDEAEMPHWHSPTPEILPEFMTLTATKGGVVAGFADERFRKSFERDVLPEFLKLQRWFAGKDAAITSVRIEVLGQGKIDDRAMTVLDVGLRGRGRQRYFMPLSALWGEAHLRAGAPTLSYTLAKARRGPKTGALIDAAHDPAFAEDTVAAMQARTARDGVAGQLVYSGNDRLDALGELSGARHIGVEQSNASIIVGEKAMLKVYRRIEQGAQPEVEVARYLTEEAGFAATPAYLGAMSHAPETGEPTVLAAAFEFVPNQGDGWSVIVDALERAVEAPEEETPDDEAREGLPFPLDLGRTIGRRTAELHQALARDTEDEAFAREPVTKADLAAWVDRAKAEAASMFETLEGARGNASDATLDAVDKLLAARGRLDKRLSAIAGMKPSGAATRVHGDFHLGQVLVAKADILIIDFEGEPRRSLDERRAKTSPLRDVAGMLRSFDYAAYAALDRVAAGVGELTEGQTTTAFGWRDQASADLLEGYREAVAGSPAAPDEALERALLDLFRLEKAFYEVGYEAANRPNWLSIPVRGVLSLLENDR